MLQFLFNLVGSPKRPQAAKPIACRARLGLDSLEGRLAPAALSTAALAYTAQGSDGVLGAKTQVVIGAAHNLFNPVVILPPSTVIPVWQG